MSNACGRCGRDPAAGFAIIDETRYCHEGESPTCYELASQDQSLRRVLGDHVDNPQVQQWVREFQIFMHDRETWYPGRDAPFWDRLGMYGDLAAHLPISVNERGQGPTEPDPAHHYECWCVDPECPLTMALQHAWLAGRRSTDVEKEPEHDEGPAKPFDLDAFIEGPWEPPTGPGDDPAITRRY